MRYRDTAATAILCNPPAYAQIDPNAQRTLYQHAYVKHEEGHIKNKSTEDNRILYKLNIASKKTHSAAQGAQDPFSSKKDCFQSIPWSMVTDFMSWIFVSASEGDGSVGCAVTGDCVFDDGAR